MIDEIIKELAEYLYITIVAFIGGILSYTQDKTSNKIQYTNFITKLGHITSSICISMFAAYLTYEFAQYFISKNNICVALGGLGAYAGRDALEALKSRLLINIKGKDI